MPSLGHLSIFAVSQADSFDSLHIQNDAVFLLPIAASAHTAATGGGVYVCRNEETSGRRSSPSVECSPLPGLRGHQQQSRRRMRCVQEPLTREPSSDAWGQFARA